MDSSSGERYKGLKSKKKKRTQRESSVFLKCTTRNRSSPDVFIYFNQTSGRVKSQENLYISEPFSHSKKNQNKQKRHNVSSLYEHLKISPSSETVLSKTIPLVPQRKICPISFVCEHVPSNAYK